MINQETKIADLLTTYPEFKSRLIEYNSMFKNLNNPVVFNTVGKFARIQDIAKVSGENVNELLDFINSAVKSNK